MMVPQWLDVVHSAINEAMPQWLDIRPVILGAILVITAMLLYVEDPRDKPKNTCFVLINAGFTGALISMIINYSLSVCGEYFGIVPALLLSGWVIFSVGETLEKKCGLFAGGVIMLGSVVGALITSWGHILMFAIFAFICISLIVFLVDDILNRIKKKLKK